jgi:putative exosortase-associated protein (TIGR04073 family)
VLKIYLKRRQSMKKVVWNFLAVSLFLIASFSPTWADSTKEKEIIRQHVHKFSRGVINIGTAPLEIPKQMIKRAQDGKGPDGELAGYLTGTITGVGWGLWRLTSGIVDVFSAPFSGNEKGLIDPEFISEDNPLKHPLDK